MAISVVGIEGLYCAACVGRAERVLAKLPGVTAVEVNLAAEQAKLTSEGAPDLTAVAGALSKAGYGLRESATEFVSEAMSCASCVARVEKIARAEPGVLSASANLAEGRIHIRHHALAGLSERLSERLAQAGYPVAQSDAETPGERQAALEAQAWRRFVQAGLLTLPVFVLEMGGHMVPGFHHWLHGLMPMRGLWAVQALLTGLVLAGPGRVFLARGLPALLRGAPDMNSLVALGTLSAFLYSALVLLWPDLLPPEAQQVWFEAAAVIVTLILLGRALEARARGRTGAAIRALMALQPDEALIEGPEGPVTRPCAALRAGDVLLVRPGERLGADGVILTGRSHLDESMLTGEPIPAERGPGDEVSAGTINGSAALRVAVRRTGSATRLGQIVAMVGEAQAGKLPIQALVDRVTAVFVPVVMALAALAVLGWLLFSGDITRALVAGVSVLIVACPCAMGLATPVSIMVGTGRAAQLGVLFRKGEALQRLAAVREIAFDKTGTLTEGRPALVRTLLSEGADEGEALTLAAAAEAQSEHHIAHALRNAAQARGLALPEAQGMETRAGYGLSAQVGGRAVLIGSEPFLRSGEVTGLDGLREEVSSARRAGLSAVYLAVDGRAQAAFLVADPLKAGAKAAVAQLQARGLSVRMISGDAQESAEAVAADLGLREVIGGATPEAKSQAIAGSGPVAFVGDGINDAPVLAAADVGLAMGAGTDVAIEAADVVLVGNDPRAVVTAVELSRATMRNIKQNLFWAFGYNAALIPVAAGLLQPLFGISFSPVWAAGAMALSSVFVLGNALRLRRAGRPVAG